MDWRTIAMAFEKISKIRQRLENFESLVQASQRAWHKEVYQKLSFHAKRSDLFDDRKTTQTNSNEGRQIGNNLG